MDDQLPTGREPGIGIGDDVGSGTGMEVGIAPDVDLGVWVTTGTAKPPKPIRERETQPLHDDDVAIAADRDEEANAERRRRGTERDGREFGLSPSSARQ